MLRSPPIPLHQSAVLLEQQEPPRQLDHATAHTGVARSCHPFLAVRATAPVKSACQPFGARLGRPPSPRSRPPAERACFVTALPAPACRRSRYRPRSRVPTSAPLQIG